jgi:dTDP-4-amino-4,6-dideoxygalactose transaminase
MIPISRPYIGREEQQEVLKVLKSGYLVQGEKVEEFEKAFAKYCQVKYAIATSSGTTALHLALLSLDIGPGDEVITTPFTFIASVNSILYVGAKPAFVDIDLETFNINPQLIEKAITSRTKAILPVHLFGLPANMEKILKIAKKYKLVVVEDACQAHGAEVRMRLKHLGSGRLERSESHDSPDGGGVWKKVGSIGDVGCFSFYPTKNMTCGEGGMVTTNDEKIARKIRLLRNHGMGKRYHYEILGYNFRMTEVAAAIGLVQLRKLDVANFARIQNAKVYNQNLKFVTTPFVPSYAKHVYHQYTIRVNGGRRDEVCQKLKDLGIETQIYYPSPIYRQKFYPQLDKLYNTLNFPETKRACQEVLSLPVYPALKKSDVEKVVDRVNLCLKQP